MTAYIHSQYRQLSKIYLLQRRHIEKKPGLTERRGQA